MSNQDETGTWPKDLLTVQEVADHLRVSRVTVWRWCQQGILPAFRIGRSWRIHRDKLLELQEGPDVEDDDPETEPPSQE